MAGRQDVDYEVYRILDKRETEDSRVEYFIRWKGFNSDWDTWEPFENLSSCWPKIVAFEKKIRAEHIKNARELAQKLVNRSKMAGQKKQAMKVKNTEKEHKSKMKEKQGKQKGKAEKKRSVSESGSTVETVLSQSASVLEENKLSLKEIGKHSEKKYKATGDKSPGKYKSHLKVDRKRKSSSETDVSNMKKRKYVKQVRQKSAESKQSVKSTGTNMAAVSVADKVSPISKSITTLVDDLKVKKEKNSGESTPVAPKKVGRPKKLIKGNNPCGRPKKYNIGDTPTVVKKVGRPRKEQNLNSSKKIDEKTSEKLKLYLSSKVEQSLDKKKKVNGKNSDKLKLSLSHLIRWKESNLKKASVGLKVNRAVKRKLNCPQIKLKISQENYKSAVDTETDDDDILYSLTDAVSPQVLGASQAEMSPVESNRLPVESNAMNVQKKVRKKYKGQGDKEKVKVNKEKVKINKEKLKVSGQKVNKDKVTGNKGKEDKSKTKKIRLLDSLKIGTKKPAIPVRPVSPTPLFIRREQGTSTATVLPTSSSPVARQPQWVILDEEESPTPITDLQASLPMSPASMSYKMLLDNLPRQLHPKKNKKLEETDEEVERRLSVRASECAFKYKEIVIKKCSRYTQIWLNTHTKMKNALNPLVMQEICAALNAAKYDDSNLVVFSGLGNVFCSGIDLQYLTVGDRRVAARKMVDALRDLVRKFIMFPKQIIAVVTGPAIGLGCSLLPLCDIVYASDKATFFMPYAQLSQTPEGCATYTFLNCVGNAMANELLIGGRKITAIEACQLGLVSQVFWPTSMMQEVIPRVQHMAQLSGKVLETTKLLMRSHQRTKLDLTNESECNLLVERWPSADCQKCIEEFMCNEKNYSL